jgi:outer membrane protein assembly factor BamD (BamD/ComL family)
VRGNGAEAIEMLEAFIQRYPASPLTQDAHVELFRGFVQMGDRAAAARAARRYLALYGDGFARDEARALALEPGAAPLP